MIPWENVGVRAGDILNRPFRLSWNVWDDVVGLNIVRAQRHYFGSDAYVWTTHTMYALSEREATDFTLPECRVFPLSELRGQKIRVLRYRGYDIAKNAGLCTYIAGIAESYKGKRYDWLDLLQFLASEAVGYDRNASQVLSKVIGLGRDRLVCSTYAATLYRKIRHYLRDVGLVELPKLFQGLPVELTFPAQFDNAPAEFEYMNR